MQHIIIGDLHGRDGSKRINFSNYQKAVFLGDHGLQFPSDAERMHHFHSHMTSLPVSNTCIF